MGLNHASEAHGFEGEGFSYIKSPIWWAGIATSTIFKSMIQLEQRLIQHSDHRRSCQLRSIRICAGHPGDTPRGFECADRVCALVTLEIAWETDNGNRAVLGSYFLGERLGTLGKLGCAICLIGSVVIVLHAPPDTPVETIDEILNYAIQFRMRISLTSKRRSIANVVSFPVLLLLRHLIRVDHDLLGRAQVRQEKPDDIPQHLQHRRIHLYLRCQGLGYRPQAYVQRKQPAYSPEYLCLLDCHSCRDHDPDELL